MSIRFDNKVALVTGGAMGIGLATAKKFAELGANVAILDRDVRAGEEAAKVLSSSGRAVRFFECDVSEEAGVARSVKAVGEQFGGIDVLISNAGIQRYGDVLGTSEELWNEVIDVNLKGCFHVAKAALPLMIPRGGGAIVVVASVQAFTAVGNSAAYVTAKHALLGLVRAMSLDYASKNIRVNCVCPGAIDTPMLRWAPAWMRILKGGETCNQMHPLGRISRPEEVANAIAFLPAIGRRLLPARRCLWLGNAYADWWNGISGGRTGAATKS
jgi:NAD(P)-dependent dehydrogenase (short-subunit alcohol dehydrogenase family)